MAEKKTFEILSALDVSKYVEKKESGKQELSYLSWTYAVDQISKYDPEWSYKVLEFDADGNRAENGIPCQKVPGGYLVQTEVTVKGETKGMWLPVMDSHNASMKDEGYKVKTKYSEYYVPPIDAMAINKTIMRCLVKNLAMFGLGLYIYAGEDLPISEEEAPQAVTSKSASSKKEEPKPAPAPEPEVAMTLEDALNHTFINGGDALKGNPVSYLVNGKDGNPVKDKDKAIQILSDFSKKGIGADKVACATVLAAIDKGEIEINVA